MWEVFLASVFRMEWLSQRSMCRLVCLFCTPHFKLTISRTKRSGIEEIMIGHIFLTSLVWSGLPHPECWHWHLHITFPVHQMFHPWSCKEALENVLQNMQSFLLTHPRVVSPGWCSACGRHFALCGTLSFSLAFWVGSSRMVVAHLACSVHAPVHKGAPIMGVMRRSWFWWRTHEHLVCWFFMR